MEKILDIQDLYIHFAAENGLVRAVDGISLQIHKGETLGIVGESGSGKSVTALSVMRLLPPAANISSGQVLFTVEGGGRKAEGADADVPSTLHPQPSTLNLLALREASLRHYRGAEVAMIFQEPMTSLNPVFRCGHQITEAIQLHRKVAFEEAKTLTLDLFKRVKLPDPERIFRAYPHQLSGGQKQRVMIAMAMSCLPSLLIADEPTTALDVTVQKAILDLMRELKAENDLSMLFISHDLGVIAEIADRVAVMYRGKIVEEGPVEQILQHPQHPYTQGLVACRPSLHRRLHRLPTVADFLEKRDFEARVVSTEETAARRRALYAQAPILEVKNLQVRYPAKKNWLGQPLEWLYAVNDVSFEVFPGETFGLAGESGCGKTTLGRTVARLQAAQSGEIWYKGKNLLSLDATAFRPLRRDIQVVFQDPYSSLNPRMTVGDAILEPLQVHHLHGNDRQRRERVAHLLQTVGLEPDHARRYPHEFSGGQRQRICIARALALEPRLLICDEIVSALDVSVQATVLNLLAGLREQFNLSYLFISHDLSVVKQMCDRVMVMNQGRVEALDFPEVIFENPEREYVRRLVEAIPGQ